MKDVRQEQAGKTQKENNTITFQLQHSFLNHCIPSTDRSWYLSHCCIDRFESKSNRRTGVCSTLEKVTGEKGKLSISSIQIIFSISIQSLTRCQLLNTDISYSNQQKSRHWFSCLSSTLDCSDFKCVPFVRLKSLTANSYAIPKSNSNHSPFIHYEFLCHGKEWQKAQSL